MNTPPGCGHPLARAVQAARARWALSAGAAALSLWALGRWTEGRAQGAPILAAVLAAAAPATMIAAGTTATTLAVGGALLLAALGALSLNR